MKTFGQFLAEGREAPLYHAMSADNFVTAWGEDTLRRGSDFWAHWPAKDNKHVSLTRDFTFAKYWAVYTCHNGIILELNQAKLAQRFKITPFSFFAYEKGAPARRIPEKPEPHRLHTQKQNFKYENQFEEAVTQDIKPLNNYVNKIIFWQDKQRLIIEQKCEDMPNYNLVYNRLYDERTKEFVNL